VIFGCIGAKVVGEPIIFPGVRRGSRIELRGEELTSILPSCGELFATTNTGVDKDIKVKDWTDAQAAEIRSIIGSTMKVEGELRSEVQLNIKRLMDIGCYRGIRHRLGLPLRGQSTKNNARTRKGKKKTVANKKKATK